MKITSQFVKNDTMTIELLHFAEPGVVGEPSAVRNRRGLTHMSFYVDDVDAAAEHLVAHGATILPDTRSSVGVEILFLSDPDGVRGAHGAASVAVTRRFPDGRRRTE